MEPYIVIEARAKDILTWLTTRGGLAVWSSLDLSDPGRTWTTPLHDTDGNVMPKPHWAASSQPTRVITNPEEILVSKDVEHKRFKIAVRMGGNGLKIKCTDASSRRIRREIAKAGKGAYYLFDDLEAVIMLPESQLPLLQWVEQEKQHRVVETTDADRQQKGVDRK